LRLNITGLTETQVLEYVAEGLKREHARLMAEVEAIARHLRQTGQNPGKLAKIDAFTAKVKKTHRISAEGRARISAAQKKRWKAAKNTRKPGIGPENPAA
jgi:hypothetical protein